MAREAVLHRTHKLTPMIAREIERLRRELPECDLWLVGFLKDGADFPQLPEHRARMYHRADLSALRYAKKLAAADAEAHGSTDLPVLAFYREQPGYDFYWIIEYDVRYTGNWSDLFAELRTSRADLLCTTLRDFIDDPNWSWWNSLLQPKGSDLQRVCGFMPFCRVSNRALAEIDAWYRAGGSGHSELVWPSLCKSAGFEIVDIGGAGPYTPPKWRHRHYLNNPKDPALRPGTFKFRPAMPDNKVQDEGLKLMGRPMLWHPVKS